MLYTPQDRIISLEPSIRITAKVMAASLLFYCTTTGAATLTIDALTVSAAVTVDWGDNNTNTYTGAGARTHNYSGAGTWTVKISPPKNITTFRVSDTKITLNSADIKQAINMSIFYASNCKAGKFNSIDVSTWRPSNFRLYSMSAGYTGTFNSSDISAWRPSSFILEDMPSGYAGTFNSVDVSAWNITSAFHLDSMPTGYAGTFNSADVSSWRPSEFYLHSMPVAYAGTFNSADASSWRPGYFWFFGLPGIAGTFNSADVSSWNPTTFFINNIKSATYTVTVTAGGFAGFKAVTSFRIYDNALAQAAVDQVLADFWTAFATRTGAAGTINVGGTNAAPSGLLQAANPPTTGKEFAYELKNDSQNINPTHKWATVTIS